MEKHMENEMETGNIKLVIAVDISRTDMGSLLGNIFGSRITTTPTPTFPWALKNSDINRNSPRHPRLLRVWGPNM